MVNHSGTYPTPEGPRVYCPKAAAKAWGDAIFSLEMIEDGEQRAEQRRKVMLGLLGAYQAGVSNQDVEAAVEEVKADYAKPKPVKTHDIWLRNRTDWPDFEAIARTMPPGTREVCIRLPHDWTWGIEREETVYLNVEGGEDQEYRFTLTQLVVSTRCVWYRVVGPAESHRQWLVERAMQRIDAGDGYESIHVIDATVDKMIEGGAA